MDNREPKTTELRKLEWRQMASRKAGSIFGTVLICSSVPEFQIANVLICRD